MIEKMNNLTKLLIFSLGWCLEVSGAVKVHWKYDQEKDVSYWHNLAYEELQTSLKSRPLGVARNVILFLGDGMGPSTVTAARILAGQKLGLMGEEHQLSFDKFPYTGISKTYTVDGQVADSAASATAFLSGVKTNQRLVGLSALAQLDNCTSSQGAHVDSILHWSAAKGKSTGIVTTTRVTHATPAAAYAHSPNRKWESNRQIPEAERACEDIALQLIRNNDINVVMGGGRAYFYPERFSDPDPDPDFDGSKASRTDNRNLVQEWLQNKARKDQKHSFIYNKSGLERVKVEETDYLLGLFAASHMSYEVDRDPARQPSLSEMVEVALQILSKNEKGFFLLVEGGRIDHAHHDSQPSRSLHEVIALAKAVDTALKLTNEIDTLIVVTADHSHVMNIAGYPSRGNPILGLNSVNDVVDTTRALDGLPYTTILYATGPGYNSSRQNLTTVKTESTDYVSQSAVPMDSETHGGEDVMIYATGPHSFLYTGVHQQSYIPLAMAYASCVGPSDQSRGKCAQHNTRETYHSKNLNNAALGLVPAREHVPLAAIVSFIFSVVLQKS